MGKITFRVFYFLQSEIPARSYTVRHIAMELGIDQDDVAIACISDKRIKQGKPGSYDEWMVKL